MEWQMVFEHGSHEILSHKLARTHQVGAWKHTFLQTLLISLGLCLFGRWQGGSYKLGIVGIWIGGLILPSMWWLCQNLAPANFICFFVFSISEKRPCIGDLPMTSDMGIPTSGRMTIPHVSTYLMSLPWHTSWDKWFRFTDDYDDWQVGCHLVGRLLRSIRITRLYQQPCSHHCCLFLYDISNNVGCSIPSWVFRE